MTLTSSEQPTVQGWLPPTLVWLDLSTRCVIECRHCYADASPRGDHGSMSTDDWLTVVDQAAALGAEQVTLIGGEPLVVGGWAIIARHAVAAGLTVEVFSSLALTISSASWQVLQTPGITLASSYYSADPWVHDAITTRAGSHAKTRANIAEAVRRRIPLRVGIIDLGLEHEDQDVDATRADLLALGVTEIGYDRLRAFGRGAAGEVEEADTCGLCGHGAVAVGKDGQVWPCPFTRQAPTGWVREQPLAKILAGATFFARVSQLDRARHRPGAECRPTCSPGCSPTSACAPRCYPGCVPHP